MTRADRGVGLDRDLRVLNPARLITGKPIRSTAAKIGLTLEAFQVVGVEHRRGEEKVKR